MAIQITSTGEASFTKKVLVYGKSGVGKTKLCSTLNNPVIISSEKKLESLSDVVLPVWTVDTLDDFEEAVDFLCSKKAKKKYSIGCIDSITDIAERGVQLEKPNHADPRKAYGVVQDRILASLRKIQDSQSIDFYIIAKCKMYQNDEGIDTYGPKMPGQQMGPELPYIFDYVFALKIYDDDGEDNHRYLQTSITQDIKWEVKDSSGILSAMERPDLGKVLEKIKAPKSGNKKKKNKKG